MKQNINFLILVLLLLSSCAKKLTETDLPKVKREKTQDLVSVLDSLSTNRPKSFYTKISTHFADTNRSISFKTSLRLVADSAINTIITYASIPIINALIRPDSLFVVNKREKCIQLADMEYIKENFGVDFNFKNIEEIIMGLPLDYDTTQKYFQIHEPFRYVISSHRKRRIKRTDRLNRAEETIAIKYFLNRDKNQLDGMEIISSGDTASIFISYEKRVFANGFFVPEEVKIRVITPRNNLLMELSYMKIEVNEPQEMYFVIPEGYEECE